MTFKGTVTKNGKTILLENGARLTFEGADCESPIRPGDRVVVDTAREPPIRKDRNPSPWNPTRETKISAVEATKAFEALLIRHGDDL